MIQLIVGFLCIIAVLVLRDEKSAPRQGPYPKFDPMVVLMLDELDAEDD